MSKTTDARAPEVDYHDTLHDLSDCWSKGGKPPLAASMH